MVAFKVAVTKILKNAEEDVRVKVHFQKNYRFVESQNLPVKNATDDFSWEFLSSLQENCLWVTCK